MDAADMTSAEYAAGEWDRKLWEDEQMKLARLSGDVQVATRRLLDAWHAQTVYEKDQALVLETLGKLVRGHALVVPDDPAERWEAATPGRIHNRDIVRVKPDAYTDEVGQMHNRRRGRVIAVRYGDIVVRYEDGRQPPFSAVHHAPAKLERLIK